MIAVFSAAWLEFLLSLRLAFRRPAEQDGLQRNSHHHLRDRGQRCEDLPLWIRLIILFGVPVSSIDDDDVRRAGVEQSEVEFLGEGVQFGA